MNKNLQYRLYSIGIAFTAGYVVGSIIDGFLRRHVEGGPFWSICSAAAVLVILLYNWLKTEES